MHKPSLLLALITFVAFSQTPWLRSWFTVDDQYNSNVLFLEDSTLTVSQMVQYPGLVAEDQGRFSIGYSSYSTGEPDPFDSSWFFSRSRRPLEWYDLYSWGEIETPVAGFGGWIGDLEFRSFGEDREEHEINGPDAELFELSTGAGRCAIWCTPKTISVMRGLALEFKGNYRQLERHKSKPASDGRSITGSQDETRSLSARVTSLYSMFDRFNLSVVFEGGGADVSLKRIREWISDQPDNQVEIIFPGSEPSYDFDSTHRKAGVAVGIVSSAGMTVTAGLAAKTNNVAADSGNYYGLHGKHNDGSLDFVVEFSKGKRHRYGSHSLGVGVDAIGGVRLPVMADSHIAFSDLPGDIDLGNRTIYGSFLLPTLLKVNLFNSSMYSLIRLTPELYLSHTSSEERDKREEYHSARLYLEELALGLTGKLGDRVEFSLIPSLQSKVFVAGLEVGYSFGGKKRNHGGHGDHREEG